MTKILTILTISLSLFGCANNVWVKRGATSEDFNVDSGQCNAQSFSIPFANVYQQAAVQNQCMQGKGWALKNKSDHESAVLATQNSWQLLLARYTAEGDARCKDPSYSAYFSKTSCISSNITFDQMSDASKITAQQKVAFSSLRRVMDAQLAQFYEAAKNTPGVPGDKMEAAYKTIYLPETDKNSIEFYSGKITWGEYNQKRKEIGIKFNEATKKIK